MTADDETQDLPGEAPLGDEEQEQPLEQAEQAEPGGYSIPPGEE